HLIWIREIGVIENIERLGAELHIQSLTDSYPLQERRVDIEQTRPTQRSASHVPESPLSRQLESKGIEPAVRSARLVATGLRVGVRGVWIANGRIPVRYVGITGIARSGRIGAGQRRE